jgi:hypothetical protein
MKNEAKKNDGYLQEKNRKGTEESFSYFLVSLLGLGSSGFLAS